PDLPPPADGYTYTVARPDAGITFQVVLQNVDGKVAEKTPATLLTAMEHHLLGGVKNAAALYPSKDETLDGHLCRDFFRAHQENITVRNTAVTPDGKLVFCAATDGVVRWWDLETLALKGEAILPRKDKQPLSYIAPSPDGKYFAAAYNKNLVMLVDTDTKDE